MHHQAPQRYSDPHFVYCGINPLRPAIAVNQIHTIRCTYRIPDDPTIRDAVASVTAWLNSDQLEHAASTADNPVFGHGDPNLANYLSDGDIVRCLDFEDSGRSDRAYEIAMLCEHLSVWADANLSADQLLDQFNLTCAEHVRVHIFRRLFAGFWLMMLLPDGPSHHRNPPETLHRQANRALQLL
jgi:thiamine kinase-like enzyme